MDRSSSWTNRNADYIPPSRVARMAVPSPRPPPSTAAEAVATARRAEYESGGSILPVLPSVSPSVPKRTSWTTPRSPNDTLEDEFHQSASSDSVAPPPRRAEMAASRRTEPRSMTEGLFASETEQAQLAYMEQMYGTIKLLNAELESERRSRTAFEQAAAVARPSTYSSYSSYDEDVQIPVGEFDEPPLGFTVFQTPVAPSHSPRKLRTMPSPPSQPPQSQHRVARPPVSPRSIVKHDEELCATLGKNAELRIRSRDMERTVEKTELELELARKQIKMAERRAENREDKLRALLKEKLIWQKELKATRAQVVEEKMRQVDLFREVEASKRHFAAELESAEQELRAAQEENAQLRTHVGEVKAQMSFQARKMEEMDRQSQDEKARFVAMIEDTRHRFREWKEGEAEALAVAHEQVVRNLKTEYELKLERHQDEKQKLREKVNDLEVSMRLLEKNRSLSPLELSLRKAAILGSKDNAGTIEAEQIEARSRILELEHLLAHSQEYQIRQESIIKLSEATISRLMQEREVTALENLSLHPFGVKPQSPRGEGYSFDTQFTGYVTAPSIPTLRSSPPGTPSRNHQSPVKSNEPPIVRSPRSRAHTPRRTNLEASIAQAAEADGARDQSVNAETAVPSSREKSLMDELAQVRKALAEAQVKAEALPALNSDKTEDINSAEQEEPVYIPEVHVAAINSSSFQYDNSEIKTQEEATTTMENDGKEALETEGEKPSDGSTSATTTIEVPCETPPLPEVIPLQKATEERYPDSTVSKDAVSIHEIDAVDVDSKAEQRETTCGKAQNEADVALTTAESPSNQQDATSEDASISELLDAAVSSGVIQDIQECNLQRDYRPDAVSNESKVSDSDIISTVSENVEYAPAKDTTSSQDVKNEVTEATAIDDEVYTPDKKEVVASDEKCLEDVDSADAKDVAEQFAEPLEVLNATLEMHLDSAVVEEKFTVDLGAANDDRVALVADDPIEPISCGTNEAIQTSESEAVGELADEKNIDSTVVDEKLQEDDRSGEIPVCRTEVEKEASEELSMDSTSDLGELPNDTELFLSTTGEPDDISDRAEELISIAVDLYDSTHVGDTCAIEAADRVCDEPNALKEAETPSNAIGNAVVEVQTEPLESSAANDIVEIGAQETKEEDFNLPFEIGARECEMQETPTVEVDLPSQSREEPIDFVQTANDPILLPENETTHSALTPEACVAEAFVALVECTALPLVASLQVIIDATAKSREKVPPSVAHTAEEEGTFPTAEVVTESETGNSPAKDVGTEAIATPDCELLANPQSNGDTSVTLDVPGVVNDDTYAAEDRQTASDEQLDLTFALGNVRTVSIEEAIEANDNAVALVTKAFAENFMKELIEKLGTTPPTNNNHEVEVFADARMNTASIEDDSIGPSIIFTGNHVEDVTVETSLASTAVGTSSNDSISEAEPVDPSIQPCSDVHSNELMESSPGLIAISHDAQPAGSTTMTTQKSDGDVDVTPSSAATTLDTLMMVARDFVNAVEIEALSAALLSLQNDVEQDESVSTTSITQGPTGDADFVASEATTTFDSIQDATNAIDTLMVARNFVDTVESEALSAFVLSLQREICLRTGSEQDCEEFESNSTRSINDSGNLSSEELNEPNDLDDTPNVMDAIFISVEPVGSAVGQSDNEEAAETNIIDRHNELSMQEIVSGVARVFTEHAITEVLNRLTQCIRPIDVNDVTAASDVVGGTGDIREEFQAEVVLVVDGEFETTNSEQTELLSPSSSEGMESEGNVANVQQPDGLLSTTYPDVVKLDSREETPSVDIVIVQDADKAGNLGNDDDDTAAESVLAEIVNKVISETTVDTDKEVERSVFGSNQELNFSESVLDEANAIEATPLEQIDAGNGAEAAPASSDEIYCVDKAAGNGPTTDAKNEGRNDDPKPSSVKEVSNASGNAPTNDEIPLHKTTPTTCDLTLLVNDDTAIMEFVLGGIVTAIENCSWTETENGLKDPDETAEKIAVGQTTSNITTTESSFIGEVSAKSAKTVTDITTEDAGISPLQAEASHSLDTNDAKIEDTDKHSDIEGYAAPSFGLSLEDGECVVRFVLDSLVNEVANESKAAVEANVTIASNSIALADDTGSPASCESNCNRVATFGRARSVHFSTDMKQEKLSRLNQARRSVLLWRAPMDTACIKEAVESAAKRRASKRRTSRRPFADLIAFPIEIARFSSSDTTLLAYDARHEQTQPFSLLDQSILTINPNGRHIHLDDQDERVGSRKIIGKRKTLMQELHSKYLALRQIPRFNYTPMRIKFQWSDFVVATPVRASTCSLDEIKSPVEPMRILQKKGAKLPCGSYVVVSAFIRPLEDGNENLRVQIYDAERVEEFQFDFSEDIMKKYHLETTGIEAQSLEFLSHLEFRRDEETIIIKLPEKKAGEGGKLNVDRIHSERTMIGSGDPRKREPPPNVHRQKRPASSPTAAGSLNDSETLTTTPPTPANDDISQGREVSNAEEADPKRLS